MGQQVGLLERRVVVRPISIEKTISKLTNSFTMMKFLAMFCLFIALFNEMEAKPIEGRTRSTMQVECKSCPSGRQDESEEEIEDGEEDDDDDDDDDDEASEEERDDEDEEEDEEDADDDDDDDDEAS